MTDFRALCAELVAIEDALTGRALVSANQGQALDGFSALAHFRDIADRARAALARPKLQGPTDDELLRCLADVADECLLVDHPSDVVAAGRSLLARWGRPAIEPVPVAERLPGPEDCTANPQPWQPPAVPVDLLHKCVCAYWLDVHIDGGQPVAPGQPGYANAALRMSDVLETLSIWIEQWADDQPSNPNAYDVAALLQRKAQQARQDLAQSSSRQQPHG